MTAGWGPSGPEVPHGNYIGFGSGFDTPFPIDPRDMGGAKAALGSTTPPVEIQKGPADKGSMTTDDFIDRR